MALVLTNRESERKKERKKEGKKERKTLSSKVGFLGQSPFGYKSINDNHNNNYCFNNVITVDVKRAALAVDPRSFKVCREVISISLWVLRDALEIMISRSFGIGVHTYCNSFSFSLLFCHKVVKKKKRKKNI